MVNRVEADNGYIIKAIVDKRLKKKKKKKMLGDHSYANTYTHIYTCLQRFGRENIFCYILSEEITDNF